MSATLAPPRRKALLIAIDYANLPGHEYPELLGGQRQLEWVQGLLIDKYGFNDHDVVIMKDFGPYPQPDGSLWPTSTNILRELDKLVADAAPCDRFFFYFTGHGSQRKCRHGSEPDLRDEAIVDVQGVKLIDNRLHERIRRLPIGAKFFALFDCCHSATILDLPHTKCNNPITKPGYSSPAGSSLIISEASSPYHQSQSTRNTSIMSLVNPSNPSRLLLPFPLRRLFASTGLRLVNVFLSASPAILFPTVIPRLKPRYGLLKASFLAVYMIQSILPFRLWRKAQECDGNCEPPTRIKVPSVICLSACKDSEEAWDDDQSGESVTKFVVDFLGSSPHPTLEQLIVHVREKVDNLTQRRIKDQLRRQPRLRPTYQMPMLSGFSKLDLSQPFCL